MWSHSEDPTRGFDYLYLTDADYQRCVARFGAQQLPFEAVRVAAQQGMDAHWRLTDIVGEEDGLGVECLSGSGAIASAFSRAYDEVFTVTLVSGRTVGIGAYLARLGHRCVRSMHVPSAHRYAQPQSAPAHRHSGGCARLAQRACVCW